MELLPPTPNGDRSVDRGRVLRVTTAADVQLRPVKWLWDRRIALGALTLLAGREGVGKSTIAYSLVAQITRGTLAGQYEGTPKSVIVAATEDSWEHTIAPRLSAAGADLNKVLRINVTTSGGIRGSLSFPDDLPGLGRIVRDKDVALLVLDPLLSRLDSGLDTHKDAEVRRALEPLTALADQEQMAVLGLIHVNKSYSSDPLQLIMGSRAFSAVARSVLFAMADSDDEALFHLGMPKNNLGRIDLPTLDYRIGEKLVGETEEGPVRASRVDWVGETHQSIRDLLEAAGDLETRTATQEAAEWMADYLRSVGGTSASSKVKDEGRRAGHNAETLKRARRQLRVVVTSSGFPRVTYWSIPGPFQLGHQLGQIHGETTLTDLTDSTGHNDPQSGQSGQSGQSPREGDPTGGAGGRSEDLGGPHDYFPGVRESEQERYDDQHSPPEW